MGILRVRMSGLRWALVAALSFKVVLAALFSSGYQDSLFFPFVRHFLQSFDNPWQYFYEHGGLRAFPYPPLMLYILSLGALLPTWLPELPRVVQSFLFKLPTIAADFLILLLLLTMFPARKKAVFVLYFLSPITLFAAYLHSQLDLIPTALLLLSVFLLTQQRDRMSGLVFGLAICTKFHVIAALPLLLIYQLKNRRNPWWHLLLPPLVYLVVAAPYLLSPGYFNLVLNNPEQRQVFSVYFPFQDVRIYLAPLAILLICARFIGYAKINRDLLLSTMGLLFSVFLLLVPPMPAWYLWVLPFIAMSLVKMDTKNAVLAYMVNGCLSAAYLVYFLVFHRSSLPDLAFLGTPLNLKLQNPHLMNLSFTVLEGGLLATIYFLYRYGIKSNSVYRQQDRAFVIGIGGDSGAGKSTLLNDLRQLLTRDAVIEVEGDGYHKWERGNEKWTQFTHLNPKANHLHLQSENLLALKRGVTIERVEYDHSSGTFTAPQQVTSNDYILICGLHPFYLPKMRKAIDLKIYLETDERLRRHWKIRRDTVKRGYTIEKVVSQIEARMEDAERYIWPQKQYADLVISYVTDAEFELGAADAEPPIDLRLALDSSINVEPLIAALEATDIHVQHDFSQDLKTQYLVARTELLNADFEALADEIIENKDEVMPPGGEWRRDFRGFVQLIILLLVSEQRREVIDDAA